MEWSVSETAESCFRVETGCEDKAEHRNRSTQFKGLCEDRSEAFRTQAVSWGRGFDVLQRYNRRALLSSDE